MTDENFNVDEYQYNKAIDSLVLFYLYNLLVGISYAVFLLIVFLNPEKMWTIVILYALFNVGLLLLFMFLETKRVQWIERERASKK